MSTPASTSAGSAGESEGGHGAPPKRIPVNGLAMFADSTMERQFRRNVFMNSFPQHLVTACSAVVLSVIFVGIGIGLQDAGAVSAVDAVLLCLSVTLTGILIWQRHSAARKVRPIAHAPHQSCNGVVTIEVAEGCATECTGSRATDGVSTSRLPSASGTGNREWFHVLVFDSIWWVVACLLALRPGLFLVTHCPVGQTTSTPPASGWGMCDLYRNGSTVYELVAFPFVIAILYAAVIGLVQPLVWLFAAIVFGMAAAAQLIQTLSSDAAAQPWQSAALFQLTGVWVLSVVAALWISRRRCYDLRSHFATLVALEEQNELDLKLQLELSREREARARVEAAQRTHSVVGHYVAHQLRNPLHQLELLLDAEPARSSAAVQQASPLAASDCGTCNFPGAKVHFIDAISHMRRVVDDMQLYEQLLAGDTAPPLNCERVNITEVVSSAVQSMAGGLQQFDTRIALDVPTTIRSDGTRLQQLVTSLLAAPIQLAGITPSAVRLGVSLLPPSELQRRCRSRTNQVQSSHIMSCWMPLRWWTHVSCPPGSSSSPHLGCQPCLQNGLLKCLVAGVTCTWGGPAAKLHISLSSWKHQM